MKAPPPRRLAGLVSVRDVEEARLAAAAGADFIDLKDPAQGALGALALPLLRAVVAALRQLPAGAAPCEGAFAGRISATVGDLPLQPLAPLLAQVQAVAACGVDYVKVGLPGRPAAADGPSATEALQALAALKLPVVPVLLADASLDPALLALACRLPFPALMLDTADKAAGSLLQRCDAAVLRGFVQQVQAAGVLAGLAGALRLQDLPALQALAPDFAGFRSAVCAGPRAGALDAGRLQALLDALRAGGRGAALSAARSPVQA